MAHLEYYDSVKIINDTIYQSHKQLIENVCTILKCPERTEELIKKLLDETTKLKKPKKDPDCPKRARSAYMFFCEKERGNLDSKLSCIEMAKELGKRWTKMTDDQKKEFQAMADQDKERFVTEMQAYKNKLFVT